MKYTFRKGLNFPVKPQIAGRELERIRKENDQLTAALVVMAAEPADAPLHDVFEWDDATAAARHRESVARNLIRSVAVVRQDDEREPMYVHVRHEKRADNSYEPVSLVVTKLDQLEAAIAEGSTMVRIGTAIFGPRKTA